MNTLYDILEVSPKASKEVIEKAYRVLAKKYHPDVNPPDKRKEAEEMMKLLNMAYETLIDDEKRKLYDARLSNQQNYNDVHFEDDGEEESQKNKEKENINVIATPHPWVRFFAKIFDVYLGITFIGFVLALAAPTIAYKLGRTAYIGGIVGYIMWLFIESLLISKKGTTPGKWILNTKIVDINGNLLSYKTALKRCFLVFVKGLGFGIPIINMIVASYWYAQIKDTHLTSWDIECQSRVITGKIEWWRFALLVFFLFLLTNLSNLL